MLIRESISFQRGLDPKASLGIGERFLIEKWLEKMEIFDYIIRQDLTISTRGDVNLERILNGNLPDYISFTNIGGYFDVGSNEMTSLRGCPKKVKGFFACDNNLLTSLDGCPISTGSDFYCTDNDRRFTKKDVSQKCDVKGYIYVG